ncbi:MAG: hypothetical protein IPP22_10785 [Nitrosomonas sp.]|nr:hypothetical protein [Nitrosomonas sp.]
MDRASYTMVELSFRSIRKGVDIIPLFGNWFDFSIPDSLVLTRPSFIGGRTSWRNSQDPLGCNLPAARLLWIIGLFLFHYSPYFWQFQYLFRELIRRGIPLLPPYHQE